jgi:hypothetical protein
MQIIGSIFTGAVIRLKTKRRDQGWSFKAFLFVEKEELANLLISTSSRQG